MLWMMVGRSLAAAACLGGTVCWVVAMSAVWGLGCGTGCSESLVLAVVGLAMAPAAFVCSRSSRRLGLLLPALHALLFAINLAMFWHLAGTPWKVIPPAVLVAAFGVVAVGGLRRPLGVAGPPSLKKHLALS
jgi:hypothetical protein